MPPPSVLNFTSESPLSRRDFPYAPPLVSPLNPPPPLPPPPGSYFTVP